MLTTGKLGIHDLGPEYIILVILEVHPSVGLGLILRSLNLYATKKSFLPLGNKLCPYTLNYRSFTIMNIVIGLVGLMPEPGQLGFRIRELCVSMRVIVKQRRQIFVRYRVVRLGVVIGLAQKGNELWHYTLNYLLDKEKWTLVVVY